MSRETGKQADWRRKTDEIMARIDRLYLKTNGQGPSWERLEAVVAEIERERGIA